MDLRRNFHGERAVKEVLGLVGEETPPQPGMLAGTFKMVDEESCLMNIGCVQHQKDPKKHPLHLW